MIPQHEYFPDFIIPLNRIPKKIRSMKTILFLAAALAACTSCRMAEPAFVLQGEIDGLTPGDTLFLTSYLLPEWQPQQADTIYVAEPGRLSFSKLQEQTAFYLLSYAPRGRERLKSCMSGDPILAQAGDTTWLKGTVGEIGALSKTGGFYRDTLMARYVRLRQAHDLQLIDIYRHIMKGIEENQPDTVAKYGYRYNTERIPETVAALNKQIAEEVNDREYAAYLYLTHQYEIPFADVEKRYNRFTPEIQASYMGRQLKRILEKRRQVEPGNNAPAFHLVSSTGKELRPKDYRGSYLLVYYWGLCPGTFAVQPELLKLYADFHEKGLEIIGCTTSDFTKTNPELLTDQRSREELKPLLDQPWETVYLNEQADSRLKEDYNLTVLPTLTLISPKGKVLVRGYGECVEKIKNILKER